MKVDAPVRIFVSYAHEDKAWHNVLFRKSLQSPEGSVCPWTDAMLQPGMAWDHAIRDELEHATVAILLVSRHFAASDYIRSIELPSVLQRRTANGLKLLWIPIGVLERTQLGELAAIQAVWSPDAPLTEAPDGDPDVVARIAREVRGQLEAAIDPIGVPLMRELDGRYEPFVRIGHSSGVSLYRTRNRDLGRTVVVKALGDERMRDAFVKNVRDAVALADEPYFANLYDAVLSDRRPYCVMQYIEGQNLRRWIEADARRPLALVIRILAKLARALVAVHARGAHYGNLKPSNVILSTSNEPYVLPMGRRVEECRGPRALDELECRDPDAEEIAYLAPEQFDADNETVPGALTDQYMLGLLAYHLVTGTLPPTLGDMAPDADGLAQIRRLGSAAFSALPPATDLRPDCPDVLAGIIRRMTSLAPEDRYRSLADLLADVRGQEDTILAWVRESYKRCLGQQASGGSFFEAVYGNFFARKGEARALFARLGTHQYEVLEKAVVDLFAFYEQERAGAPDEPNVLTQVAQKHDHRHLNVAAEYYGPFKDALIDTVCGTPERPGFDPRCHGDAAARRRMRRAWEDVLRPGIAYMKDRY